MAKPGHAELRLHPLPEIVRQFKTFSARRINQLRGTPGISVWQRNYYEHVFRHESWLNRIRQYIQDNPCAGRWIAKILMLLDRNQRRNGRHDPLTNADAKLHLANRTQAALFALRKGLADLEEKSSGSP